MKQSEATKFFEQSEEEWELEALRRKEVRSRLGFLEKENDGVAHKKG